MITVITIIIIIIITNIIFVIFAAQLCFADIFAITSILYFCHYVIVKQEILIAILG